MRKFNLVLKHIKNINFCSHVCSALYLEACANILAYSLIFTEYYLGSLCYKYHPVVAAAELQQIYVHCGTNKKYDGYRTRGVV